MTAQRADTSQNPPRLKTNELQVALATATAHAARGARRLRLTREDRDDLRQDILVALLERLAQFDPARGAWSTFMGVVARSVVADRVRESRQAMALACLSLDLDQFPEGVSVTRQDRSDAVVTLDLQRVAAELPQQPRKLLRLIVAMGDVAAAQHADARSSTTFYRALADLRCWLRASGMRPPAGTPRQTHAKRWEKSPFVSVEKEMPNHA
ncbi:sigma factor [Falsiroseomonas ponticola]|uniref:sigma factor n=1 Tax=Falsiroseomonas ponticola TaxID=2786951 RepID=UPI0019321035|nr:sigma factor [Roseomonas ponticola]